MSIPYAYSIHMMQIRACSQCAEIGTFQVALVQSRDHRLENLPSIPVGQQAVKSKAAIGWMLYGTIAGAVVVADGEASPLLMQCTARYDLDVRIDGGNGSLRHHIGRLRLTNECQITIHVQYGNGIESQHEADCGNSSVEYA